MKNKKDKKRKEFYIHQIIREEEEKKEEPIKIISFSKKEIDAYLKNVAYCMDPSKYDNLKKNVPSTPEYESIEIARDEIIAPIKDEVPVNTTIEEPVANYEEPIQNNHFSNYNNYEEEIEYTNDFMNSSDDIVDDQDDDEIVIEDEVVEPIIDRPVEVPQPKPKPRKRRYIAPSLNLLNATVSTSQEDIQFAEKNKQIIDEVIKCFNIKAHVEKYIFGPTVIQYLVKYDAINEDVKCLHKIEPNLALSLACSNIIIQTPIPSMSYSGIEVPRPKENRGIVGLGELLRDPAFIHSKYHIPAALGKDNFGKHIIIDLADMPHGLCAGQTKSGKSVCLNVLILSLLYHFSPEELRLVLIDPKFVEFGPYGDIPHLAMPVIIDNDLFEPTITWLTNEMERRYKILNKEGCKELSELNEQLKSENKEIIPYLVVIMDEFNEWYADCSNTIDQNLTRTVQKGRAAGIHIILATQRPSADVIKGSIKGNFPTRFAFQVASQADSVVILGQAGAEKLEGKGDMILRHTGMNDTRLQSAFVSNKEIKNVCNELRNNNQVDYIVTMEELKQSVVSRGPGNGSSDPRVGRNDELFSEVAYYVVENKNASLNQIQRVFGTGFNRMNDIFTDLTQLGIISQAVPGGRREVLVTVSDLDEIMKNL